MEESEKENKVKSKRKYKVTKQNKEFIVLGVGYWNNTNDHNTK